MVQLFGFEIKRKDQQVEVEEQPKLLDFAPPESDDGALVIAPGGATGIFIDLENGAKSEAELITKYRQMYLLPECQMAVDKIVNEAIVQEDDKPICEISLDNLDTQQKVKDAIRREWRIVSELLALQTQGYNIFLRFYVDGRLNYQKIIDAKNPREGIQEIRYVDPRKLRKVKTTKLKKVSDRVVVQEPGEEFFIYNERGFNSPKNTTNGIPPTNTGLKISAATVAHVTSGLIDANGQIVLGWLHKAIKPLNMLTMLEDATVIYRVSRAAERRIFNIEVGQLPKAKAEQYVKDMMIKYKNRLVYDAATGQIRDDRKYQTMYEDMWFPSRNGSGTKVDTLAAGQNLGELSDVNYFKQKLYESLNIPVSRMQQQSAFNIGRSSEITRDELDFQKFINRLRNRFSMLFIDLLGTQLILKGILTTEDWENFKDKISFKFARDNFYAELKDAEILRERLELLSAVDEFNGEYFSRAWAKTNILKQSEEEQSEIAAQMKQEKAADAAQGGPGPTYQNFDSGESPAPLDPEEEPEPEEDLPTPNDDDDQPMPITLNINSPSKGKKSPK